jgi:hypothetical protein
MPPPTLYSQWNPICNEARGTEWLGVIYKHVHTEAQVSPVGQFARRVLNKLVR